MAARCECGRYHLEGSTGETRCRFCLEDSLRDQIRRLRVLLRRYRHETPLGHQPHMIAHEADAALSESEHGH